MKLKLDVKKIKMEMISQDISMQEMTEKLGVTRQVLWNRFKFAGPRWAVDFGEILGIDPKELIILVED